MSKRKIIAAAKRKGLTVEYAEWGQACGDRDTYLEWQVQFGEEIDDLYGEDEFQSFADTAEAIEWIEQLERVSACESGQPECGPVEHYDSQGVPLCAGCWAELVADSQSGYDLGDAAPGPHISQGTHDPSGVGNG
ncbi:hypothetical protein [Stenotrophomonas bentonitica]|uniref:hypothetical protein n=1 Tax=Stenotrophomonas bentonitica TaxID=1450134 RepID=UPI003BAD902A